MAWKVEIRAEARADLDRIYDHLVQTHLAFGRSLEESVGLAERRSGAIREGLRRFEATPYRGTQHRLGDREYRHVTIDRAIYWFTLDEANALVRVIGIFHGGQNHLDRMFARLAAQGTADGEPEGGTD